MNYANMIEEKNLKVCDPYNFLRQTHEGASASLD